MTSGRVKHAKPGLSRVHVTKALHWFLRTGFLFTSYTRNTIVLFQLPAKQEQHNTTLRSGKTSNAALVVLSSFMLRSIFWSREQLLID